MRKKGNYGAQWRLSRLVLLKEHLGFNDCVFPGCTEPITLHHIVPKSKGGGGNVENILPVCSGHHNQLHGKGFVPMRSHTPPVDFKRCEHDVECAEPGYRKDDRVWRCRHHHYAHVEQKIRKKHGEKFVRPAGWINSRVSGLEGATAGSGSGASPNGTPETRDGERSEAGTPN